MTDTREMSNPERRIREWHAAYASEGLGPNAEAIRQGLVHQWWDINDLLAEIDRLRAAVGEDQTAAAIVRDLAALPVTEELDIVCPCAIKEHRPECPWRRAAEWVAARGTP